MEIDGACQKGPGGAAHGECGRSLDTALVGEWVDPKGLRLVFRADGAFYTGSVGVPYWLQNAGQTLNFNSKTLYARVPGSAPTSLVGRWRDDPNGEELEYRLDGRYLVLIDDDPLVQFGVYTFDSATVSSWEYRAAWSADLGQIRFNTIWGTTVAGSYTVTPDTLTLSISGMTTSFRRAMPPFMPALTLQRQHDRVLL
jgi:hypothetical protein